MVEYIALGLAIAEGLILLGFKAGWIDAGADQMKKDIEAVHAEIAKLENTYARRDVVIVWQQAIDRRLDEQGETIKSVDSKLSRLLERNHG